MSGDVIEVIEEPTIVEVIGPGPQGPQGPIGLPGAGHWVNVRDLSATPGSVTDWGALINDAYADGVRRFVLQDASTDLSGTDYPFTTPLDFTDSLAVTLEGAGGYTQVANYPPLVAGDAPARLIWNGTGSTSAIQIGNSGGFTMRDLGVYYSSGSFTGKLVDHYTPGGVASGSLLQRCQFRSVDDEFQSARALVGWDGSILATIDNCIIAGGEYCVLGAEQALSQVANANAITNSIFFNAEVALLGNILDRWAIDKNTFEMWATGALDPTPAVIDSDWTDPLHSRFTFSDNWVGDFAVGTTDPPFMQRADNYWYCEFSGNTVYTVGGFTFDLQGGGNISILNNPRLTATHSDPIIDLGDIGAGAVAKRSVLITGNYWTNTDTENIVNREGHHNVNIFGNDFASGAAELRTLGRGHERVGYAAGVYSPSIAGTAVLGTGGVAQIHGTDTAGIVILACGSGTSAGIAATITLRDTLVPAPEGEAAWQGPIVHLTPLATTAGHSGPNSVDAGAYVKIDEGTTFDSWQIGLANAPTGNLAYAYRVIGL